MSTGLESVQYATIGEPVNFNLAFDYKPSIFGALQEGWSTFGSYRSYTNESGESRIEFEATLKSPELLEHHRTHIVDLYIGSKTSRNSEWFATGQQAKNKKQKKTYADTRQEEKRITDLINVLYNLKNVNNSRIGNWTSPTTLRLYDKFLKWGTSRAYADKDLNSREIATKGLSLKLGQTDIGYYFAFYSHNYGKQNYGRTHLQDLILNDGSDLTEDKGPEIITAPPANGPVPIPMGAGPAPISSKPEPEPVIVPPMIP